MFVGILARHRTSHRPIVRVCKVCDRGDRLGVPFHHEAD